MGSEGISHIPIEDVSVGSIRAKLDKQSGLVEVFETKTGARKLVHAIDAREQVALGTATLEAPEEPRTKRRKVNRGSDGPADTE